MIHNDLVPIGQPAFGCTIPVQTTITHGCEAADVRRGVVLRSAAGRARQWEVSWTAVQELH